MFPRAANADPPASRATSAVCWAVAAASAASSKRWRHWRNVMATAAATTFWPKTPANQSDSDFSFNRRARRPTPTPTRRSRLAVRRSGSCNWAIHGSCSFRARSARLAATRPRSPSTRRTPAWRLHAIGQDGRGVLMALDAGVQGVEPLGSALGHNLQRSRCRKLVVRCRPLYQRRSEMARSITRVRRSPPLVSSSNRVIFDGAGFARPPDSRSGG